MTDEEFCERWFNKFKEPNTLTRGAVIKLWHRAQSAQSAEIQKLRTAIQKALDDEESGTGWGPDVTVCAYLRKALEP